MDITAAQFTLHDLERISVILGKNGSGKSSILREIDNSGMIDKHIIKNKKYLSPERSGRIEYQPNIEQNIINNERWLSDTRRHNQVLAFRQQAASQFRQFEINILRQIESDKRNEPSFTFFKFVEELNELLDQVTLVRSATKGFEILEQNII